MCPSPPARYYGETSSAVTGMHDNLVKVRTVRSDGASGEPQRIPILWRGTGELNADHKSVTSTIGRKRVVYPLKQRKGIHSSGKGS